MKALIVDGPAAGKTRELMHTERLTFVVYVPPPFSIAKPADSSVVPDDSSACYWVHRFEIFGCMLYVASRHADATLISQYNLISHVLSADAREALL